MENIDKAELKIRIKMLKEITEELKQQIILLEEVLSDELK